MKTSSTQTPKPPEPKSVLLLGPPGGRKTTLAMQFPGVYFADCDQNLDGPERFLRNGIQGVIAPYKPDLSYAYDNVNFTDDGKEVAVADKYDRLSNLLIAIRKHPEIKTVVIDSMTMVNEFILRKVMKEQGVSAMRPIDWQPAKSYYWSLLVSGIRGMGKDTIVTCHEIVIEEPDPKNMMKPLVTGYKPSVQGGISDYLGAFFTDIWRCVVEDVPTPQGTVTMSRLYTAKTAKSPDLKNSMGMPAVMQAKWADGVDKYWPKPIVSPTITPK